jgi:hypothetical protein
MTSNRTTTSIYIAARFRVNPVNIKHTEDSEREEVEEEDHLFSPQLTGTTK